ncbi:MAG: KpsF/GutQ family sugar-phosphate isomerase [Bacteroidetes bacterium]|nr:KpsF/GutQ family sugar-phosphate isomerase [Bacteroidota bacterium]
MNPHTHIIESARRALTAEGEAILALRDGISEEFVAAVQAMLNCRGRIVLTGVGKSALIAAKISATFNSTGTPALFMHAADAVHGDLGMIRAGDVVLCISQSGNTPEIKLLVPLLKSAGHLLIGLCGQKNSFLGTHADHFLSSAVVSEACPLHLAPTTSTTAQLAMGDALAICLIEERGFTRDDFARFHPGGALGKKLYLRVDDLITNNALPQVDVGASLREVLISITSSRLGLTAVMESGRLVGVITDGDIRRMLERYDQPEVQTASDMMTPNPITLLKGSYAVDALELIKKNNITQIVVLDSDGVFCGIVHLHDLLREGIL